jgi:hypothetical protein
MKDTKPWWLSRTIWVGLITSILAILNGLGVIPTEIQQSLIEEAVLGILGILAIIFRAKATTRIEPLLPTASIENN